MSSLLGIRASGSYIRITICDFTKLNVGVWIDKVPFYTTGVIVNGGTYDRCDRGLIIQGADNVYVSNANFFVNKQYIYGTFSAISPSQVPLVIFIGGTVDYSVSKCNFNHPYFNGAPVGNKTSFGLIVEGNLKNSYDLISNNTFEGIDIGFQTQNESNSTFLRCNKFTPPLFTLMNDIVISSGTLRRHDGCLMGSVYDGVPANEFSPNNIRSDRNIRITSSNYSPSNKFKYSVDPGSFLDPLFNTTNFVAKTNCGTVNGGTNSFFNTVGPEFTNSYLNYVEAGRLCDSLFENNADTGDIEAASFFKYFYLKQLNYSYTNEDQYDSIKSILEKDTSFYAVYHLVKLYLNHNDFSLAQGVIDKYNITTHESEIFKSLYNILIPIYSNYSFEDFAFKRFSLDSLASDSGFFSKQAKYLVNFIDESIAIDSNAEFTRIYVDSIEMQDSLNLDRRV